MFKFCVRSLLALMILLLLCPGLAAQTGYHVIQTIQGIEFTPYGIKVAPDGSCYTYGSCREDGIPYRGTGVTRNDPYGNRLWINGSNYSVESDVCTVGIDLEANGDFHTLSCSGVSSARISADTWHPSGTHSVDFTAEFDIQDIKFTKAIRLADGSIAVVGRKRIPYQSFHTLAACYFRFSAFGTLINSTVLYMHPDNPYPPNIATDILLMNNGHLLITILDQYDHASVTEITLTGHVIGTTPIPGSIDRWNSLCLIPDPGTSGYLAGLRNRFSSTESYRVRIYRISPPTVEMLCAIDLYHMSQFSSMESTRNGIFLVGDRTFPGAIAFLFLDPQGNLDWAWFSGVNAYSGNGTQFSDIGSDDSLYWVGWTPTGQVLVKLPADGSFVSVNDDVIPTPTGMRAYPNPTRETAKLHLPTAKPGLYEIKTYNLRGQLIKSETISYDPGSITDFDWEAKDSRGNKLPGGVYLIKLVTGSETTSTRITIAE